MINDFLFYLLKSACWLTGFTLVYLVFLGNERFFMLKRAFLITGIIVSLTFPLINVHYKVDMPAPQDISMLQNATLTSEAVAGKDGYGIFDYKHILLFIYFAGIVFISSGIIRQIVRLFKTIKTNKSDLRESVIIVRSSDYPGPFSFLNYVFVNPSMNGPEAAEIMNHELVHVKQKHWLDLILAELLRVLQWANPIAWIYTRLIRLNHEYLADQAALQRSANPEFYRAVLINQLFEYPVISLSNSFTHSLNSKRFEMMKKIITSPYRKLKVLIVLPVFAIIFYAFAIPSYRYTVPDGITGNVQSMAEPLNDADHSSSKSTDEQEKTISQVKGTITREDGTPIFRVAILVTGTQARANTDKSGKFTLNDVPTGSRIVISARGYLTQLIKPEENLIVQMLKDPEYKEKATSEALSKSLVIINGNISSLSLSDIQDSITPDQIATVSVFKGDEAVKKYGEKGKDGAVEIITKDKAKEKWIARRAFVVVEEMPMYPGGDKALLEYISNNTKYPQDARDKKIEGRVIIRFIVTSKGTVEDATVLKSAYPSLDAEALRVVSSLPAFLPGSQGGTPVDVYYKVPINFSLKEKETK